MKRIKARGLFITGTDTGVGKTLITAGLAYSLREYGFSIGVMKPVETGCREEKGHRIPGDGTFLKYMAGSEEALEKTVPYRFRAPLAPKVAGDKEGIRIDLSRIQRIYEKISSCHDLTLVEGAGGLLVPLTPRYHMADLMERLGLPVLLVGRLGLGTLNHTLLSLHYLSTRKIPVAGIILNNPDGQNDMSTESNPSVLQTRTSTPLIATISHIQGLKLHKSWAKRIGHTLSRHLEPEDLMKRLATAKPPRLLSRVMPG